MISIYCLACPDTIWYVGSTNNQRKRFINHRRKQDKDVGSDLIPDGVIWELIVLEEVEDDQRYLAERFYYEWLEPKLNKVIPGRSRKESADIYRASHKEQQKILSKRWVETHREQERERCRNYYHANKKIQR